MFQPLRPFAAATRTYEQLPLQRIRFGSARFTGWSFADGAVRVLRSQGHCVGHMIVHLRDSVEIGVGGANPNPIFIGMMAANQLREIGLRPGSGGVDAPWSRPSLDNPAVVAAMPTASD
jgi:hypothetical protein